MEFSCGLFHQRGCIKSDLQEQVVELLAVLGNLEVGLPDVENPYGRGRMVECYETLIKGQVLQILVGQAGGLNYWNTSGGGGVICSKIRPT